MIVSASRRTDIPAFYMEWFCNRLEEGFAFVRNPMNGRQVSRVDLSPGVVDGVVFWSKDPRPLLARLDRLERFPFEVQYTLNPYGPDVEPGLAKCGSLEDRMETLRELSRRTSPQQVIWRYDPILLSRRYPLEFHRTQFEAMAQKLSGAVRLCTISFVDDYRSTRRNGDALELLPIGREEMERIGEAFGEIGRRYEITVQTCGEEVELSRYGIRHGCCIDGERLSQLASAPLRGLKKDPNQRKQCGCVESVDVGAYNSCALGCLYCYANDRPSVIRRNAAAHDPRSPLLVGHLEAEDRVTCRKAVSHREAQLSLF